MAASTNNSMAPAHEANSQSPHAPPMLQPILAAVLRPYLARNPTAAAILRRLTELEGSPPPCDHFAFRTFGAEGYGIEALEAALLPLGYRRRDRLEFPKKRLRAYWYAPPAENTAGKGAGREDDGLGTMLPRVFVSEIAVEKLSSKAQEVIGKYLSASGPVQRHALLASALGTLPWPKPTYQDYQLLAAESEYAAWTLVNGYALNHATVSAHSLKTLPTLDRLNGFVVDDMGFRLNDEGSIVKVSPDGALRQSSTVADTFRYAFASPDGEQDELQTVAGSYIEFAERDVLPQYASLPREEVGERHRRDGFEVGNADGIFESTSMRQTQRA